jgi:hypothetical protein
VKQDVLLARENQQRTPAAAAVNAIEVIEVIEVISQASLSTASCCSGSPAQRGHGQAIHLQHPVRDGTAGGLGTVCWTEAASRRPNTAGGPFAVRLMIAVSVRRTALSAVGGPETAIMKRA